MNNTYEIAIRTRCPLNPRVVDAYQFTIESPAMIEAEKINAFFVQHSRKPLFQEELTRLCAVALGAKVTSVGVHSGVKVTCQAP